jgi:hypothetical protein
MKKKTFKEDKQADALADKAIYKTTNKKKRKEE